MLILEQGDNSRTGCYKHMGCYYSAPKVDA